MECVVLFRWANGNVDFVGDDDGEISVFPNFDAAVKDCDERPLFQSGQVDYQIVELDEL